MMRETHVLGMVACKSRVVKTVDSGGYVAPYVIVGYLVLKLQQQIGYQRSQSLMQGPGSKV